MNELVTACCQKGDISTLVDFPTEVLSSQETKLLTWIHNYTRKYGKPPTIRRLTSQFEWFVPVHGDPVPLEDLRGSTLKRKINDFVADKLDVARAALSETGEILVDDLAMAIRVSSLNAKVRKYSTFNREEYVRTAKFSLGVGIKFIDKAIGFVGQGEILLVAGRLGIGKTMTLCWIANLWRNAGAKILFISNEMLANDIFARLDAINFHLNAAAIRTDPEFMLPKIKNEIKDYDFKGEIIVPDYRVVNPQHLGALALNLGVDAIFIDGVYLMQHSGKTSYANTWERVASVSRELKQVALDLAVPIVGTTQIKRGEHGKLDDESIAYSDALGQDADFLLGITKDDDEPGLYEVSMLKNRFGPMANSLIKMDFTKSEFIDMSGEAERVKIAEPPKKGHVW